MRFVPFAFLSCFLLSLPVSAQWMAISPGTTVCRAGECHTAGTMEPQLLFEQIHLMFKANVGQSIALCNGVQSCEDTGLSLPVAVSGTTRMLTIPQATLVDAPTQITPPKLDLILAYETQLNNFTPVCQSAATQLDMTNPAQLFLTSAPYTCALTGQTTAAVQVRFDLDYIDLERAVLAGAYTVTVSGVASGQTAGHAILTLAKKTPVTLDKKSIGLRQPDTDALLQQARADVQAKHQQQIFERLQGQKPNDTMLQQILMQTGGRDGVYPVVEAQPYAMQPAVYDVPLLPNYTVPTSMPEVVYIQQ